MFSGNPPGVIGKKYRPTLVGGISGLKATVTASQPLSRAQHAQDLQGLSRAQLFNMKKNEKLGY